MSFYLQKKQFPDRVIYKSKQKRVPKFGRGRGVKWKQRYTILERETWRVGPQLICCFLETQTPLFLHDKEWGHYPSLHPRLLGTLSILWL